MILLIEVFYRNPIDPLIDPFKEPFKEPYLLSPMTLQVGFL